jgi:NAD(P)-dependent dehydrogenase (short-subunit alcohol dehydrogenase family)
MTNWSTQNIPDQSGKVIIVTGASSGLGKEIATVLASKNATVVMAVRNIEKTQAVAGEIKKAYPKASLDIRKLKLDSLKSVKEFASDFLKDYQSLDILINNAGVMACPFSLTEDGFEIQMGVNHLGHFALTGLLMPLLEKTKNSRIVATASIAHRRGNIDFGDINWKSRKYSTMKAYSDSKLANLYFTYELARKLENKPGAAMVVAAHPGVTDTELSRHSFIFRTLVPLFAQKEDRGSLPTLRAAIDPEAKPGDYYGPDGFKEIKGNAVLVKSTPLSYDVAKAAKLWDLSQKLTGVKY